MNNFQVSRSLKSPCPKPLRWYPQATCLASADALTPALRELGLALPQIKTYHCCSQLRNVLVTTEAAVIKNQLTSIQLVLIPEEPEETGSSSHFPPQAGSFFRPSQMDMHFPLECILNRDGHFPVFFSRYF